MYYVVYVGEDCNYCTLALKELVKNRVQHMVIYNQKAVVEAQEKYNWETIPMIEQVTDESKKFIGGYTELYEHLKKEKR